MTKETSRILVADDEGIFLFAMKDLLEGEGYRCDCARDAAIVVEMLRSTPYDLLIADVKMPGNGDLELIRSLQQVAEGLPVILVTGLPEIKHAIEAIQLPVEGYFIKPLDFEKLLLQIKKSLQKRSLYQGLRHMRKRVQDWGETMGEIEQALKQIPAPAAAIPAETFFSLTVQNIAGSLADVKHLGAELGLNGAGQEICHLFNCPRLHTFTSALGETIEVLEKTKGSFRSKELGELRVRLERLVKQSDSRTP